MLNFTTKVIEIKITMTVREFIKRLQILHFYREKGTKKTQRKFGVGTKQLEQYEAAEQTMKEYIAKAQKADNDRNRKKRSGPDSHAKERRAKKRQRIDKPGFSRTEQYVWLDEQVMLWFKAARVAKFIVTAKMVRLYASALCMAERSENIKSVSYWYRSFCKMHKVKIRKITGLRRKQYTPEEMLRVTTQYYGFIRHWKSVYHFPSCLIINMDEIPTYMDMLRGATLDFEGTKSVEARYTNYDKKRYTVNAAVTGSGHKLPISCIFRATKKLGNKPLWARRQKPACKCFFTKGGSQTHESFIQWIKAILIPYIEANGGGRNSTQWALLIFDPAPGHKGEEIKKLLRENHVWVAMMPASTTYKFQMIDVVVGKPFKDGMCDKWAAWMLENSTNGVTAAGNYKHPERIDCVKWVSEVWDDLSMDGVKAKAAELGMTSDLGPEIAGYRRNDDVVDLEPSGEEVEELIAELSGENEDL